MVEQAELTDISSVMAQIRTALDDALGSIDKVMRGPNPEDWGVLSSVGVYGFRTPNRLVSAAKDAGVDVVYDVRTVPMAVGHKRMSGRLLGAALRRSGITYIHQPKLGAARPGTPEHAAYGGRLQTHRQRYVLEVAGLLAAGYNVCLLGNQAQSGDCHRSVLGAAIVQRLPGVRTAVIS